jgi:hypothetical protein
MEGKYRNPKLEKGEFKIKDISLTIINKTCTVHVYVIINVSDDMSSL